MKTTSIRLITISLLFGTIYMTLGAKESKNYCVDYIQVWGVVKYNLPHDSKTIPNLDSAFLEDIRTIISKNNSITLNKRVDLLIKYAGGISTSPKLSENDPFIIRKIDSVNQRILLNKSLRKENRINIERIVHYKRDTINCFITQNTETSTPIFKNEKEYLELYPSTEMRLLALARFWTGINYFFPYKSLLDKDWHQVLETYCNALIKCKNESDYHLTLLSLCTKIKDGHGTVSSYPIEKHFGFFQLPFSVSYINDKVIVTKIDKQILDNPLKFGDEIIRINNKTFNDFYAENEDFIYGSNINRMKNICASYFIKSNSDRKDTVDILRNDSALSFTIQPKHIWAINQDKFIDYLENSGKQIGDKYIYLDLSKIDSTEFEELLLKYDRPNVIIDLRIYPNWVLNQIANIFARDTIPFVAYYYADISHPGLLTHPKNLNLTPTRQDRKSNYKQMILLVNYTTISRGEFLTMAFQALPNVITIGDQTAGADGNMSHIRLPGNVTTNFSGIGIEYPDGRQTQKTGITIDKYFYNSGHSISLGQDEQLNYVLDYFGLKGKNK